MSNQGANPKPQPTQEDLAHLPGMIDDVQHIPFELIKAMNTYPLDDELKIEFKNKYSRNKRLESYVAEQLARFYKTKLPDVDNELKTIGRRLKDSHDLNLQDVGKWFCEFGNLVTAQMINLENKEKKFRTMVQHKNRMSFGGFYSMFMTCIIAVLGGLFSFVKGIYVSNQWNSSKDKQTEQKIEYWGSFWMILLSSLFAGWYWKKKEKNVKEENDGIAAFDEQVKTTEFDKKRVH